MSDGPKCQHCGNAMVFHEDYLMPCSCMTAPLEKNGMTDTLANDKRLLHMRLRELDPTMLTSPDGKRVEINLLAIGALIDKIASRRSVPSPDVDRVSILKEPTDAILNEMGNVSADDWEEDPIGCKLWQDEQRAIYRQVVKLGSTK